MNHRIFGLLSCMLFASTLFSTFAVASNTPSSLPAESGSTHHKTGDTMTEPILGMEFIYIGPGTFVMGSPEDETNRYPDERQHTVEIKHGFWMSKYEVTFAQYDVFSKAARHAIAYDQGWGRGNLPVINVKWFDAAEFARWLSQKSGHHYRLPTEAEWEYAARAGTTTAFSFGNNEKDFGDYAWNGTNAGKRTHPVGTKKPNPWGLHDMHGNVWEWTASIYNEDYDGSELRGSDIKSNEKRVVRGGAWYFFPKGMRSADRRVYSPRRRLPYIGFRIVRDE
jgi:formylglycine-generating enzyme required for sulfatase activity